MKNVVALQNNLISLTDKVFPGVNEMFSSPDRADGSQKWVDFIMTFWHCECIALISKAAFTERCRKWCKRKGYHFRGSKAADLYIDSISRVDSFDQLLRRLTLIMYMTDDVMEAVTYNFYGFQFIPGTVVKNPYSTKNRPAPKVNGLDLYRSMLDSAAPLTGQEKGGEDNDPGNPKED